MTNHEAYLLGGILSAIEPTNFDRLDVDSIDKLIQTQEVLTNISSKYSKTRTTIFKSYNVDFDSEGKYDFSKHDKADEIINKIDELGNKKIMDDIPYLNFLNQEEFQALTRGLVMQDRVFINKYLRA